jgi:hypothetical protein
MINESAKRALKLIGTMQHTRICVVRRRRSGNGSRIISILLHGYFDEASFVAVCVSRERARQVCAMYARRMPRDDGKSAE